MDRRRINTNTNTARCDDVDASSATVVVVPAAASTCTRRRMSTNIVRLQLHHPSKQHSMASETTTTTTTASSASSSGVVVVRNSLLAGSVAGMASTFLLYPLDVVRTKLQATGAGSSSNVGGTSTGQHHYHRGPLHTFRHTIRHGGYRALYTGMTLPLAAQAVYKGTVFAVNNATEKLIVDYRSTTTFQNNTNKIDERGQCQLTLMGRLE